MNIPATSGMKRCLEWLTGRIRWIAMVHGVYQFVFVYYQIEKRISLDRWLLAGIAAILAYVATIGFCVIFWSIYIRVSVPGGTLSEFLDSRRKVVQPPGSSILSAARFLCTKKTFDW